MNRLVLHSLAATNYRNVAIESGVHLHDLNVFIGPNGSGKSNLLAVLDFLRNCTVVKADEGQATTQFQNAMARLGGSGILDRTQSFPENVSVLYSFGRSGEGDKPPLNLELRLYCQSRDAPVVVAGESLSRPSEYVEDPFFYYKYHDRQPGRGVVSVWNDQTKRSSHFEDVENVPTDSLGLAVLHDLLEASKNPPEATPIYSLRRELMEYINGWRFYKANNMDLDTVRTSEPKLGPSDIYLSYSGHNLALVIENLVQRDIDFEDALNYAIRSILPRSRRIRPARTGLMSVNLEWHVDGLRDCFYLNEMSDGTVRMLCWATILLSPYPASLLVIDEPELGIHPAWMSVLAEWIKKASRRTQVIISTHCPDLLDHFSDCPEKVFAFTSTDGKRFSVARLDSPLIAKKLTEGWKLGDLYRVGDPSVGGWPW